MAIARRRRADSDDENDDAYVPPVQNNPNYSDQTKQGCCGRCLSNKVTRGCLKFAFSNAGLCIIVILYTIGGGFLMQAIELGNEKDAQNATRYAAEMIEEQRANLSEALRKSIWASRDGNRDEVIALIKLKLDEYHAIVAQEIQENGYDGTIHSVEDEQLGWHIASALLFTATILTTIGYGHVFPVTELGQLVMLLYSLFAIPLMSMFLINIGSAIADVVRYVYQNGICRYCRKKRADRWAEIEANERLANGEVDPVDEALPVEVPPARPKSAWSVDEFGNPIEPYDVLPEGQAEVEPPIPKQKESKEPTDVPASLSLLIVITYLLLGTLVFNWTEEDWTLTNSVYFTFVTLSTMGFGDFVPGMDDVNSIGGKARLAFTASYIIIGLAVLAMGVDLATAAIAQRFSKVAKKIEEKAVKSKMEKEKEGNHDEFGEYGPMGDPALMAGTPNPANDIQLHDHFDDITPPAVVYR